MELLFKKYDPVLIFTGTDQEREKAEKCYEYNQDILRAAFERVQSENSLFAYIDTICGKRLSRLVLHRSAKYDCLQLTCLNYENGEFLYPVYDCMINSFEKFSQEVTPKNRIVID